MDSNRMVARYLIEVTDIELAFVLNLGVVEEEPFNPKSRWRSTRLGAQLLDDARDRYELDLVGIAHQNLIEQSRSRRVVMGVDKAGYYRHLFGIEDLRAHAFQSTYVFRA